MSPAAAATKRVLRKRDVIALLGISDREYRTYVEIGLLKPLPASGRRHVFNAAHVQSAFQLDEL